MSKSPSDYPVGTTVTFTAGPTKVIRSGIVQAHEKQFVVVKVDDKTLKTLKTRPGSIVS